MASKQKQRKMQAWLKDQMRNLKNTDKNEPIPLEARWSAEDFREYRQDLIKKVSTGELTPEEVERIVTASGDRPFQDLMSRGSLDAIPIVLTPEMAAIWFQTQDARAVHRHYLPSFEGRAVWVANSNRFPPRRPKRFLAEQPDPGFKQRSGYDLVSLERTSLFHSFVDFDGRSNAKFPPMRMWLEPIRTLLQSGAATAFGFPVNDGALTKPISTATWGDATFIKDRFSDETVLARGNQIEFRRVTFNALEIVDSLRHPLLKWKDQREEITPLARRVVNSLWNNWPFGLPLEGVKAKHLEALIDFIPEEEKKRWRNRPTEFHRFLKPVLERVCEVPAKAGTNEHSVDQCGVESKRLGIPVLPLA